MPKREVRILDEQKTAASKPNRETMPSDGNGSDEAGSEDSNQPNDVKKSSLSQCLGITFDC